MAGTRKPKATIFTALEVIRGEDGYKANTADRVGTALLDMSKSYVHLDDYEQNNGSAPNYWFPPVVTIPEMTGKLAAELPAEKDLWGILAGGSAWQLQRSSIATPDGENILDAAVGNWVKISGSGSSSSGIRTVVFAVTNPNQLIYTLPAEFPDISLNGVISLVIDGVTQTEGRTGVPAADVDFTVNARQVLFNGANFIPFPDSVDYFVFKYGAVVSGTTGGEGGPSNTVSEGDQIVIVESANVDGSTNYEISADPRVVTNQVDASGSVIAKTFAHFTDTTGRKIETEDYAPYTVFPQSDSVAKTPTSPGIAGLRSWNSSIEYSCIADSVWVRRLANGTLETTW